MKVIGVLRLPDGRQSVHEYTSIGMSFVCNFMGGFAFPVLIKTGF